MLVHNRATSRSRASINIIIVFAIRAQELEIQSVSSRQLLPVVPLIPASSNRSLSYPYQ
jgi:hypothetical protein